MANDDIVAGKLTEIANLLRDQREDQEFARQEAKAAASESKVGQEEAKQEEVSRKEENIDNQEETIGILQQINENFEGAFEGPGKGVFGALGRALLLIAAPILSVALALGAAKGFFDGLRAFFSQFFPRQYNKVFTAIAVQFPNFLMTQFALFSANLRAGMQMTIASLTGGFKKVASFVGMVIGKTLNFFKRGQLGLPGIGGFAAILDRIQKIKKALVPFITGLKSFSQLVFTFVKGLGSDFQKAIGTVKTTYQTALKGFSGFAKTTKQLSKPIQFLRNLMQLITAPFSGVLKLVKFLAPAFFRIGKGIGFIGGKLLLPLQIILGAIDTIKGFLNTDITSKGFLGSFIERIGGAVAGLLNFLFGIPFDFVKDILAFFIGRMPGKDGIAQAMKGFSFVDTIKFITEGIFDAIALMFDNPMEALRQAGIGALKTLDFIRKMVKFVLPPADFLTFRVPEVNVLGKKFGGGKINLNPIPKVLYDFANKPAQEFSGGSPNTGAQVAVAQDMNLDAKAANAASPIVVQTSSGGKTENTNIVQKNYQDNTLTDRDATLSQFGSMPSTV